MNEINVSYSMEVLHRPQLFDFHGVSMTNAFTDNWDNVQNFKARPDDILIATYPKAGTTWVSYIIDLLYFGHMGPDRQTSIPLYDRVPFLELYVVYVARNAKDNAVSYFHFERMNGGMPEPGDWSTFLQDFMAGKKVFGSWYDHVNGWWEKKQTHSNFHYMFYEDLIEDYEKEIDRLCSFLGLSPSVEEKERVRASVTFDSMKQNKMTNYSTVPVMNQEVSPFMRKGTTSCWATFVSQYLLSPVVLIKYTFFYTLSRLAAFVIRTVI
uniref:Sulfotransferase n=1 Tax=Neolamprologus brichardi TaxID=32507 RepID=A0A3Q4HMF7_NEOBR